MRNARPRSRPKAEWGEVGCEISPPSPSFSIRAAAPPSATFAAQLQRRKQRCRRPPLAQPGTATATWVAARRAATITLNQTPELMVTHTVSRAATRRPLRESELPVQCRTSIAIRSATRGRACGLSRRTGLSSLGRVSSAIKQKRVLTLFSVREGFQRKGPCLGRARVSSGLARPRRRRLLTVRSALCDHQHNKPLWHDHFATYNVAVPAPSESNSRLATWAQAALCYDRASFAHARQSSWAFRHRGRRGARARVRQLPERGHLSAAARREPVPPGSRCPGCGQPIRAFDNIPVLGWLVLRRPRCCKTWNSPRYPLVEALGGLLGWAIVRAIIFELPDRVVESGALVRLYLALALGLLAAAFIDLDHMYLPDPITIGGTVLGIVSVPVPGDGFSDAFLGAALGLRDRVAALRFSLRQAAQALLAKLVAPGPAGAARCSRSWAARCRPRSQALAVFLARGRHRRARSSGPRRKKLQALLESSEGEARRAGTRNRARDPLAFEPEAGFGKARLAFGPFLALATIEYLLFGDYIVQAARSRERPQPAERLRSAGPSGRAFHGAARSVRRGSSGGSREDHSPGTRSRCQ